MERVFIKDTGLSYDYSKLETRKETKLVVIHHTGNPTDDDLSAQEINRGHQAQGWVCVGYHYVIRKDGTIELGRPHWTVGAHAYGFNDRSIGIHLCGNFEIGTPTPQQIESVAMLLANICTDYGLPITSDYVVGHRDLMPTACPGQNLYDALHTIRGKAIFYQNQ